MDDLKDSPQGSAFAALAVATAVLHRLAMEEAPAEVIRAALDDVWDALRLYEILTPLR